MDGMGWMWGFGGLAMIAFWLITLVLLLAGIKFLFGGGGSLFDSSSNVQRRERSGSSALAVLEERYAKGEIGREEFLQKRQDILGN